MLDQNCMQEHDAFKWILWLGHENENLYFPR